MWPLHKDQSSPPPPSNNHLIASIVLQAIRSARAYLTQTLKLSASSSIGTGAHGPLLHMAPFHANRMMRQTGRQHSHAILFKIIHDLLHHYLMKLPNPYYSPSTTSSTSPPTFTYFYIHLHYHNHFSPSSFIYTLFPSYFSFPHTIPSTTSPYLIRFFRRQSTEEIEPCGPLALRSHGLIIE